MIGAVQALWQTDGIMTETGRRHRLANRLALSLVAVAILSISTHILRAQASGSTTQGPAATTEEPAREPLHRRLIW
jgi:hypothetical protein